MSENKAKFGPKQVNNPTPNSKAKLFDLLAAVCGITAGFLVSAKFVPTYISDIISPILTAFCIPLFLYLKSWYGMQIEGNKKIDESEVAVIKDP